MKSPTIEFDLHVERRGHGARKMLSEGPAPTVPAPGRVPRVVSADGAGDSVRAVGPEGRVQGLRRDRSGRESDSGSS